MRKLKFILDWKALDLFLKNMTDSPACTCSIADNAYHFFFICTCYDTQRHEMFNSLSDIPNFNLRKLMYGDENFPYHINTRMFMEVQNYFEKK